MNQVTAILIGAVQQLGRSDGAPADGRCRAYMYAG